MSTDAAIAGPHEIDAAVAALRRGELVGMPTETVYGLAADAGSEAAIARVFAAKGRPADHPLIVHLHTVGELEDWADPVPEQALALAQRFWPGPLTLILRKRPQVSALISGGQDTVGLRIPAHPVARALLAAFGGALVAPSANRYGHVSPTRAAHVREDLGAAVAMVLEGGDSPIGLESSIVDLSGETPRLLRPGAIPASAIAAVCGPLEQPEDREGPRASGRLAAHYAPRKPLELVDAGSWRERLAAGDEGLGWLWPGPLPSGVAGIALPDDAAGYGRGLYAALRALDASPVRRIAVLSPPAGEAWAAIHDRLRRAAAGSGSTSSLSGLTDRSRGKAVPRHFSFDFEEDGGSI